jgi:hypothetical protein
LRGGQHDKMAAPADIQTIMPVLRSPSAPGFSLRGVAQGAGAGGASSVLRVARQTAAARNLPVLQRARAPRQLSFDFVRGR